MKSRVQQGGVAHLIVIITLVVAVLGLLGFVLWQNFLQKSSSTEVARSDTSASSEDTSSGSSLPVTYVAPEGSEVVAERFDNSDQIHVGYGAPVFLKYSALDGWVSYQTDESGEATIKQEENLVKPLSVLAQDQYITSYYGTGDGPVAAETRVLVVVDDMTYQFALTGVLSEKAIADFIQSIKFD